MKVRKVTVTLEVSTNAKLSTLKKMPWGEAVAGDKCTIFEVEQVQVNVIQPEPAALERA